MSTNSAQYLYHYQACLVTLEQSLYKDELPQLVVNNIIKYALANIRLQVRKIENFWQLHRNSKNGPFLRKFDMAKRLGNGHSKILIIGKRATGKTILAMDCLHYLNPNGPKTDEELANSNFGKNLTAVFSPTAEFEQTWEGIVPPTEIHAEYSDDLLGKFIQRQKTILRNDNVPDSSQTIILDDCLHDKAQWTHSGHNMRNIVMHGQHFNMNLILTQAAPLSLPPALRCNLDYIFIARENMTTHLKQLYDKYGNMCPSFNVFCHIMQKYTKNYGFLVVDNIGISNRLEDLLFWHRVNYI